MANRLGYTILSTILGVSALLAACGDDSSQTDNGGTTAGAGGEATSSGGKSSGGSVSGGSAGKAGAANGGKSGGGGVSGSGGMALGGAPGAAGIANSDAGAAGADAAGAPAGGAGGAAALVYECGSDTLSKKLCSALYAANCTDPTICADCVPQRTTDYETLVTNCAACDAHLDAFYQCGVDAFESGMLSTGVECFDGTADLSDACGDHLTDFLVCQTYIQTNDCPAAWPLP